jgi:lipopolysaccharide transport system ATP-binding protein
VASNDAIITVKGLSKKYRRYASVAEGIKEVLHPLRKRYHQEFWALRDLSFEVQRGESVAIVGRNGSGKSTLLQILCGIMQPTKGEIKVNGRVSALLELGAGFHPLFTGRENVYLNGALMGLRKEEIDERFPSIADFADIGDFMDQPVRTYSSGMFVRLAFSIAVSVEPNILVVDEALAVGDMFFQAKCMDRIKKMIERGVTLLFVSHDLSAVKSICTKSLLLDRGTMVDFGSSNRVVERYFSSWIKSQQGITAKTSAPSESNLDFQKRAAFQRIQNGKVTFVNVQLLDEHENEVQSVGYGRELLLRMAFEVNEDIGLLTYGYHIRDRNGVDVVYSGALIEDKPLYSVKKGEKYIIDWKFNASLQHGRYDVACALSMPVNAALGQVEICDFVPIAAQFVMEPRMGAPLYGLVHWDNRVEIKRVDYA